MVWRYNYIIPNHLQGQLLDADTGLSITANNYIHMYISGSSCLEDMHLNSDNIIVYT